MELYRFQLTEEIVRWRFEVLLHTCPDWFIAFTNPTAGPWKRVMGRNGRGVEGEVYRFPRDIERPDLILVNDKLNTIIILEAKDSLSKLLVNDQINKSADVVNDLAIALSRLANNDYWGERSRYSICPGLLWGSERRSTVSHRNDLALYFSKALLQRGAEISKQCLCVEIIKTGSSDELEVCVSVHQHSAGSGRISDAPFLQSFSPGC